MDPAAAVDELRAGRRSPLGELVAGQRPGAVGVAEHDVAAPAPEPRQHLAERAKSGAAELGPRDVGPQRTEPGQVQRGHGGRECRHQRAPARAAFRRRWAGQRAPGLASRPRGSPGRGALRRSARPRGSTRTSAPASLRITRRWRVRPGGSPTTRAIAPAASPLEQRDGRVPIAVVAVGGVHVRPQPHARIRRADRGRREKRRDRRQRLALAPVDRRWRGRARPALAPAPRRCEPAAHQVMVVVAGDDHDLGARRQRAADGLEHAARPPRAPRGRGRGGAR